MDSKEYSGEYVVGSMEVCAGCGHPIVFIGPYWDHLGDNKPRHPAFPKLPTNLSEAPSQTEWTKALDSREWLQVLHAINYARDYSGAGVPGHGQFMLIAKLAKMLGDVPGVTAAVTSTASINDAMSAVESIAELVGWPCFDSDRGDDNFSMQFKRGGL